MVKAAAEIFRLYETDNVPASGANDPNKADVLAWTIFIEALLQGGGPGLGYTTKSLIDTDLAHAANTLAIVYADSTATYNGTYRKSGASGAGSWTRIGDLPGAIVLLTVTGGSGDAITATAIETPQNPGAKIFIMVPTAANTGAACAVAVNGASPVSIKNALGSDPAANTLVAGVPVIMIRPGSDYRLVLSNPVDTAGVVAAVTAAMSTAATLAAALGNQAYTLDRYSDAQGATIPVGIKAIRLMGYFNAGDAPVASYFRVNAQPAGANKLRSTDRFKADGTTDATHGGWWQMVLDDITDVRKFGVIADATLTDRTTRLNDALACTSCLVPPSAYKYVLSGDIAIPSYRDFVIRRGATLEITGGRITALVPGGGYIELRNDGWLKFLATVDGAGFTEWGDATNRGLVEMGGSAASPATHIHHTGNGRVSGDYAFTAVTDTGFPAAAAPGASVPIRQAYQQNRKGIAIMHTRDVLVEGQEVFGIWGEAIYDVGSIGPIKIRNNWSHDNAFTGLNFNTGTTFPSGEMTGNTVENCYGVELSGGSAHHNVVRNVVRGIYTGAGGGANSIDISHNHIATTREAGIDCQFSSTLQAFNITNNQIEAAGTHGIICSKIDGGVVSDNTIVGHAQVANGHGVILLADAVKLRADGNVIRSPGPHTVGGFTNQAGADNSVGTNPVFT